MLLRMLRGVPDGYGDVLFPIQDLYASSSERKRVSPKPFARVDKLVTGKDSNRTQAQCPMLLVWSVNVHISVGKV